MTDFITSLMNMVVASTDTGVTTSDQFKNITGDKVLHRLKQVPAGDKDGSHFLRTTLNELDDGRCTSRGDNNSHSLARMLIIDCDKRIDSNAEELDGAPCPIQVSESLKSAEVGHIIYGSYSYYSGLTRYRIILITKSDYTKEQLADTAGAIVSLINANLNSDLLAYASENGTWSQPWYYPRRPESSTVKPLYIECLGDMVDVIEPQITPPVTHAITKNKASDADGISPIHAFNEQMNLTVLLASYGYRRILVTKDGERWLSPDSKSKKAGVLMKDNKFFCHHGSDQFNDGYWHSCWDLMRGREDLSEYDAIIKAAQLTTAPDGRTVDEYNKSLRTHSSKKREPLPLPEPRPAVSSLQADMLPEAIKDYIFDVADRQQSLPDFVAVAAIVGLSGLLGRKALICPKQLDDWSVTPNQWGAIIGRPSAMKSPSMKEALKPLREFDKKAAEQFKEDKQTHEEECQLNELEKLAAKDNAKKALKAGNRQEAKEALKLMDCAVPPIRQRLVVNDATIEKLGELLNENPNGLILVRDELSGWLAKLNKEEYQSDRAFYLECFDGNGSYTYDRIGRGTIEIENCTLSIIGGIQPSKIATLVRDAIKGSADDGLVQRLQLAIWPDDIGSWTWIDRAPNQQAKAKYNAVFKTLHRLEFYTSDDEPPRFRFTPEAQELFIIWMKEIQDTARNPETHPAIESHMLKMPQTIAGLALLFEIIDGGREAIGIEATVRALDWGEYLLSHALRLYSLAINHSLDGARLILKRRTKLPEGFTARDIQRKGWSGLDGIDAVNEALAWLIDYGHIEAKTLSSADTNGRPKIVYHLIATQQIEEAIIENIT